MLSMYTKSQLHWQRPVGAVGLAETRINDRYSGHYSSGWTIYVNVKSMKSLGGLVGVRGCSVLLHLQLAYQE